jgi:lysyl-tRNA synthetase class 2
MTKINDLNWQKLNQKEFFQTFEKRARIINYIREFFLKKGFLEVETPTLVKLPGMEPNLFPFKTELLSRDNNGKIAYLITSPEYQMKKLLCGGMQKIWQITNSYRNKEELSKIHNCEFKLLEWYRVNADYKDIMKDTEDLIYYIHKKLNRSDYLLYNNKKIDLRPPWLRISCRQIFKDFLNLDILELYKDKKSFLQKAKNENIQIKSKDNEDTIFYRLFLTYIEPYLGINKPVILKDYPASLAALSVLTSDNNFAERFEVYISGVELANAFSELIDPHEQFSRFKKEQKQGLKRGKEFYQIDMSFIKALKKGMPPSAGIALGVDRLVMLLLGKDSLKEVLLFPQNQLFE